MTGSLHHRLCERADLKAEFKRGASILMLAPRRIGKTWLLGQVAKDMSKDGWLCVSIDLEGKTTEDQFLRELCQKIEETRGLKDRALAHFNERFKSVMRGVEGGSLADAVGKIDHREFLEALVKSLDSEKKPTLILIDELALFFLALANKDADQAKSLLYHLRRLTQAYKNVRWFLTGSVGLDAVARRHGIEGAILGVELFTLNPFSPEEAESFIAEMFDRVPAMQRFSFATGALARLTSEVGWLSPYHVEQVVKLIRPKGDPKLASVACIDAAITEILRPDRRLHFAPWAEHLDKNFDASDSKRMHAILDILCGTPEGEMQVTLLTRLQTERHQVATARQVKDALIALEADAYLVREGDRWKFRSGLLRRFWLEYCQE